MHYYFISRYINWSEEALELPIAPCRVILARDPKDSSYIHSRWQFD